MGCWGRVGEQVVDLSGDVAFQAAGDLGLGFSVCLSPGDILFGAGVVTHSVGSDPPQRVVGLPVAASVEPVTHYPSR